jgi:hypothetical protein
MEKNISEKIQIRLVNIYRTGRKNGSLQQCKPREVLHQRLDLERDKNGFSELCRHCRLADEPRE